MFLHLVSLRGPFSLFLCNRVFAKFSSYATAECIRDPEKWFSEKWRRSRVSCFGKTDVPRCFEEVSIHGDEIKRAGLHFMNLMEERGITPNLQTFLWRLEDCLNNRGSLEDGKKLHGKILKMGMDELCLCQKLIDYYIASGNLDGAVKIFDQMPYRGVFAWNKVISGLALNNFDGKVLTLCRRMLMEGVDPNESTFVGALKACRHLCFVLYTTEQVHARIICQGYEAGTLVGNLLIDIYAKNGMVNTAKRVFDRLHAKDNVSWVAIISGLSQNECEEEAIQQFCKMHALDVVPTPYMLSSSLSACTKVELFNMGEQIHGLVIKSGLSSETYVCNALVTLYSRSGKLLSAEQIFRKMRERDSVTYNTLISGLAQCGYGEKAMDLLKNMQADTLKPDPVTVACLLGACASIGALVKGQQLHAHAVKSGFASDIIIEGALLDLYVKCLDVETAHEFFLGTTTENVVLWNLMLVAYGQLDDVMNSFRILSQMQIEGIIPNQFTYPSILKTCTSLGALDLGEQIHTQVIKTGFQLNVYVCSVLIDMYSKLGKLETAMEILQKYAGEDVVSWTAMIAGYTQHGFFAKGLDIYWEMLDRGIRSDNIGLASVISACAGLQALNVGRQVHTQSWVSGYSDDPSIQNALVSLYSRCGRLQEAYLAFEKNEDKNNISWNALVSGFSQSGLAEEALRVFARMNRDGIGFNLFSFGSAVSAAANTANIKQGKQIHAVIMKTGFDLETEVCNALVSLYAKCGSIEDAKRQFVEMPDKNEVSWNSMITGYSQHGSGKEAIKLFETMRRSGIKPNHVTFIGVLSACSHVGLVEKGLEYFASMSKEHYLVPKSEHYVCVVDILSRAGQLSRAREFIDKMPIEPDALIWRTLLSSCVIHKNMEIGEFAAQHLLELEPEDSATYVLLSNIYAVSKKWEARDLTRKMMKEKGVRKEPGRSWIEVKNSIHAFFVGDRLHPLADKIYHYLDELDKRAAEIGYVQDRFSILNEADQEQKDPTATVHSEKLAISFGLLSLPRAVPIRVMKNLRVCNDCHNWIKFVSKVSDRAIVVRDAYRFHHFEGGLCSCKDYW